MPRRDVLSVQLQPKALANNPISLSHVFATFVRGTKRGLLRQTFHIEPSFPICCPRGEWGRPRVPSCGKADAWQLSTKSAQVWVCVHMPLRVCVCVRACVRKHLVARWLYNLDGKIICSSNSETTSDLAEKTKRHSFHILDISVFMVHVRSWVYQTFAWLSFAYLKGFVSFCQVHAPFSDWVDPFYAGSTDHHRKIVFSPTFHTRRHGASLGPHPKKQSVSFSVHFSCVTHLWQEAKPRTSTIFSDVKPHSVIRLV